MQFDWDRGKREILPGFYNVATLQSCKQTQGKSKWRIFNGDCAHAHRLFFVFPLPLLMPKAWL